MAVSRTGVTVVEKAPVAHVSLEERIEGDHKKLLHEPAANLHETVGKVVDWRKLLPESYREVFDKRIVDHYLARFDTGKTYGILLAGEAKIQSAAPKLHEMLMTEPAERQPANIRSLITSLGGLRYAPAYEAIEQFVNSEYSLVAIHSLARIDFARTIPHLNSAMAGKYAEWQDMQRDGKVQRLALMFADLMYDAGTSVGPKVITGLLEQNKNQLKINPQIAKEAFAQAFDFYLDSKGNRYTHAKRAHYYIKQAPRILTGKQGAPVQ